MSDTPSFSRTNMQDHAELRVWVPLDVLRALDAEVISRGGESANVYRATIVSELLKPWAEKKVHDATLLLRLMTGNPNGSEHEVGRKL